jgi:hypothetical protein
MTGVEGEEEGGGGGEGEEGGESRGVERSGREEGGWKNIFFYGLQSY